MTTIDSSVSGEHPGTRRLLRGLAAVLGAITVGLAVLLAILFLRGSSGIIPPGLGGSFAGYPIQVEMVLSRFGPQPGDVIRSPLAAAFDKDGNTWVSDTGNSRVLVFDTAGRHRRTIGAEDGPGRLSSPYGLAVDTARKRAYVADYGVRAVREFTTSGAYVRSLPVPEQDLSVFGPNGFSPYEVRIVSGRVVASSNDGLYFFDRDGLVQARWGGDARGAASGEFNFPDAFDVDPKTGQVFVADTLNRRVVALDAAGSVEWISGRPDVEGRIAGFWQLPRSITVGPNGNLYVVDTFRFDSKGVGLGHVVVLSPEGKLLSQFARSGTAEGSFNFPEKLSATARGLFAIADRENNRVVLFRVRGLPKANPAEVRLHDESFSSP